MPAKRVCPAPGCPTLIPAGQRRCARHAREHERARGTRQQRGYDRNHDLLRASWRRRINDGEAVRCARCGGRIHRGDAWALDHTDDRSGYLGPSHAGCNNSAGGRAAHR